MLSYHGKLVIYVQDTKKHHTVILTLQIPTFLTQYHGAVSVATVNLW